MPQPPLRRLFVPAADPAATGARIKSLFHRHVQSAITPPLVLQVVPGGVVVDLDVRVYDNYRVEDALAALRAEFPNTADLPEASPR